MSIENHKNKHNDVRSYLIGFIFSIILTAIPYWIVMSNKLYKNTIKSVVLTCAILQIAVHLIYFLHLDTKSENGWNLLAIIFSLIVILIIVSGSLWIMGHLNHNMMIP